MDEERFNRYSSFVNLVFWNAWLMNDFAKACKESGISYKDGAEYVNKEFNKKYAGMTNDEIIKHIFRFRKRI
jgi:hypothetical protein